MSTFTMPLAGLDYVGPAAKEEDGFLTQLARSREAKAEQVTLAYLAAQTDARLASLGFTAEHIRALRASDF